jgi:hypothetical protein
MNGPYQTARDAARSSDWSTFGREAGKSMADANLIQLYGELSGVDLGDWDKIIIEWLAGYEPSTVTAVCGLIRRAREAGTQEQTGS